MDQLEQLPPEAIAYVAAQHGLVSNPSENNGPLMSGVLWFLWVFCGLFLCLRLHVRLTNAKLWWDDAILFFSWLCLLGEVALIQAAVNKGYGHHLLDLDPRNVEPIVIFGASSLTCSVVSITTSKISFGVTLMPLTEIGKWRWVVLFAISTLGIFAIPVTILPWVQCKPLLKTFVPFLPGECINKQPSVIYGMFQAFWSALMDFTLALLPWKILWGLQMRKVEKIGVGISMSLGILAGATAIVRSLYIAQLAEEDVSYDAVESTVWSATESTATIIAASIPVLRKFVKDKVTSAVEAYGSRKTKSGSGTGDSNNQSRGAGSSALSSTNTTTTTGNKGHQGTKIVTRITTNKPPTAGEGTWYEMQCPDDSESGRSILREGELHRGPSSAGTTVRDSPV